MSGSQCRLFAYGPADATASQNTTFLASFISRLVLRSLYQITQVVLVKGPLDGCSTSYTVVYFHASAAVRDDRQARKLNKEDAMDRCKWRKLIKDV